MNLPAIGTQSLPEPCHSRGVEIHHCSRMFLQWGERETAVYTSKHPRALTSWLCWRDSRLLTREWGRRSRRWVHHHIPISSAHYHRHTPFTSTPPSPPFLRCLVTLARGILLLPSSWRREKEAAAHYYHVPRAPLLALPACPSCCSVQLWLSTRPWPAGISTLPESRGGLCESSSTLLLTLH